MRYLTSIFLVLGICYNAVAAECPDGYTLSDINNCTITCRAGYYVATPGAQCEKITDVYTYTDAPHTVAYGETSDAFLKKCPRTANGDRGSIPRSIGINASISSCNLYTYNVRMTEIDRYDKVNCTTDSIYGCVWLTHGTGGAACYYTTGADGAAIYDNRNVDPATGAVRLSCVGGSYLDTCDAGYYAPYINTSDGLQHHPCNPVGTSYWSPDGDLNRYECPPGTATCGFGECADSADDCVPYKTMKISGHGDVLLFPTARSEKPLVVRYGDGTKYYGMTTPATQPHGIHIKYPDGTVRTLLSPTDSFVKYYVGFNGGQSLENILMFD